MLGVIFQYLSGDDRMSEAGKPVILYHPLDGPCIGYGVHFNGGDISLRRVIHVNALINGPKENLVVI